MGKGNNNLLTASESHDQDGRRDHIRLKLFFSAAKGLMVLALGMQLWGYEPNII